MSGQEGIPNLDPYFIALLCAVQMIKEERAKCASLQAMLATAVSGLPVPDDSFDDDEESEMLPKEASDKQPILPKLEQDMKQCKAVLDKTQGKLDHTSLLLEESKGREEALQPTWIN